MYIMYIDESGLSTKERYLVLSAAIFHQNAIQKINADLNKIKKKQFGSK